MKNYFEIRCLACGELVILNEESQLYDPAPIELSLTEQETVVVKCSCGESLELKWW